MYYVHQSIVFSFLLAQIHIYSLITLLFDVQSTVDFRASCFCHGQPVEFANMCSVCLALTCSIESGEECATCGTKAKKQKVSHSR